MNNKLIICLFMYCRIIFRCIYIYLIIILFDLLIFFFVCAHTHLKFFLFILFTYSSIILSDGVQKFYPLHQLHIKIIYQPIIQKIITKQGYVSFRYTMVTHSDFMLMLTNVMNQEFSNYNPKM